MSRERCSGSVPQNASGQWLGVLRLVVVSQAKFVDLLDQLIASVRV